MKVMGSAAAILLSGLSLAGAPIDWHDGHAELDGYELSQPRYGEMRRGRAVMVFVKEDFSDSARVKADPGKHPPSDVFPVLKLNLHKSFQTGIYDYNLMTSAFVKLSGGAPVKLAFSNQEWCGTMFEELLFDEKSIRAARFSYFDGEGDEKRTLDYPAAGIALDTLPILVRQITGAALVERGKSREVMILPSLERTRLVHRSLEWQKGTLARSDALERRTVPAGAFEVEAWTLSAGGETYRYYVEAAEPRRLIEWEGPQGERAQLTGSARLKYWQLNKEGDEKFLKQLGLDVKR